MDKRGKFIVIDGMDGSGKGTQIRLLQDKLAGKNAFFTREPGGAGNALAEEIRAMLLRPGGPASTATTDFFLFFASRAAHIELTVEPMRQKGTHVLSDRYDSSTFAFQIRGENTDPWLQDMFMKVRETLPAMYYPDLYIVLDLSAEVAYERRAKDAAQEKSKFDTKPLEYHERVRAGFNSFAQHFGPVQFVDAQRTPEEVHADIWKLVSRELGLN
ncbi:MAG TPA: dTMP kinase [Candidatus Paceibacterota bacterium]|nr:dTMP kinase [Candidatus Paceibacterota bacterium]